MNALKLHDVIIKNGGITVNDATVRNYTAGYQVSTPNSTEIKADNLGELLLIVDALELRDFGMWLDAGVWYLDTETVHTDTLEEAQAIGRQSGQLAVYEWSTGDSIAI